MAKGNDRKKEKKKPKKEKTVQGDIKYRLSAVFSLCYGKRVSKILQLTLFLGKNILNIDKEVKKPLKYYIDKNGLVHRSRKACIEANNS